MFSFVKNTKEIGECISLQVTVTNCGKHPIFATKSGKLSVVVHSGLHASCSARDGRTAGYVTVIANEFNLEGTKRLRHRLSIYIPHYNE
jgi:hypothetical protein